MFSFRSSFSVCIFDIHFSSDFSLLKESNAARKHYFLYVYVSEMSISRVYANEDMI